ncbi:MAG: thermonuclease family protein [Pirellulales bacterium]|nr:thermonuclease family protein [Pirellulales bacterium]
MSQRSLRGALRRLPRRQRQIVLLIVVVAALLGLYRLPEQLRPAPPESLKPGTYQVKRVIDGDTLLLGNGARVRLIGADTPETVRPNYPVEPWGPEATQFTRDFVAGGRIRLQLDGPPKDKYDRFLAHVWVGDRMLEEELLRAGLANAATQYRYSAAMKARFVAAEAEARSARRGIWSR